MGPALAALRSRATAAGLSQGQRSSPRATSAAGHSGVAASRSSSRARPASTRPRAAASSPSTSPRSSPTSSSNSATASSLPKLARTLATIFLHSLLPSTPCSSTSAPASPSFSSPPCQ